MIVGFRVDAAKHIGMGHLQRCLTLAHFLKSHDHTCIFYCRQYDEGFYNLILQSGFELVIIGFSYNVHPKTEKDWLGVPQSEDRETFINLLNQSPIDICIVDHYSLDIEWEEKVKQYVKKLVVIDDLANRQHDCCLLIDQNYLPDYENRYDLLIPSSAKTLLGPAYILLRDEFSHIRAESKKYGLYKPQILINFGGVGNFNFLKKVIEATNKIQKYKYLIITGNLIDKEYLELKRSIRYEGIQILKSSKEIAKLMSGSEFAIGASGSTVWERFYLGLNSALIQMADNQAPLLNFLYEKNLIDKLGDYKNITVEQLSNFLDQLDLSASYYLQRQLKIMELVDGNGVKRVGELILELSYA